MQNTTLLVEPTCSRDKGLQQLRCGQRLHSPALAWDTDYEAIRRLSRPSCRSGDSLSGLIIILGTEVSVDVEHAGVGKPPADKGAWTRKRLSAAAGPSLPLEWIEGSTRSRDENRFLRWQTGDHHDRRNGLCASAGPLARAILMLVQMRRARHAAGQQRLLKGQNRAFRVVGFPYSLRVRTQASR